MSRVLIIFVVALAFFSCNVAYPARQRQLLPHVPGYIPVYIRNGDTPLEDINLDLAEAFHSIPSGRSAGRSPERSSGRSNVESTNEDEENSKNKIIPNVEPEPEIDTINNAALKQVKPKEAINLDVRNFPEEGNKQQSPDVKLEQDNPNGILKKNSEHEKKIKTEDFRLRDIGNIDKPKEA